MLKRREMIRRMRKYQKGIETFDQVIDKEYLNKDNQAVVFVDCNGISTLFDPLSVGEQLELITDLTDFLDRKMYFIPLQYPIVIRFIHCDYNEETKNNIRLCLSEHYCNIIRDKQLDYRVNRWKIVGLIFLGLVLLSISFTIRIEAELVNEFLSVAGTFSLWEAVDFYLLERGGIQTEKRNATQAAMASIEFEA